ncbi:MAG TPA: hypothetical protein VJT75_07370 [Thermoleophilaceae bacterium]|nr:hypothetical protein [Thermoleophilaceae bacterium]
MKRVLVTAASAAIALAAPGAAAGAVQTDFKAWKVETKNGRRHSVEPGASFDRCGRTVVQVIATYDYSGAQQGKAYNQIWSLDGTDVFEKPSSWKHTNGTVHLGLFKNSGKPLEDGKYRLRLRQSGKGIGSSSIRIRPGAGC